MIKTANLTDCVSRKAGGLYESVRRLVQSLAEKDVGVRVLSVEDEFTEEDLSAWKSVPIDLFPRTWPFSFGYSPGFLRVLKEYRPDLTHTHGIWLYPSIATSVYCTRRRVPYMISPHGMVDPWAVQHHRWKKIMAYALFEFDHLRGARCIRALCESEARSIRRMGLKNAVAVIPNGIDLPTEDVTPDGNGKGSIFEPFARGRQVLLYLGRLHPKKGLPNLLRAWAESRKSKVGSRNFEEWTLAIAGWDEGGHERELERLKEELEIGDSVTFLGPQFNEAKMSCYRQCDAFILPSLSEGLPMVVLEAWAYGKPVLMTAACNLPEGFAAEAAIEIGTAADEIGEGLQTLCGASRDDLSMMGRRGRTLVEARFTWSRVAEQAKTTYEWMLGGGERPEWMFATDGQELKGNQFPP